MKNFSEIIYGIPSSGRWCIIVIGLALIGYIFKNFILFFFSENYEKKYQRLKKMCKLVTAIIVVELMICYLGIFHSNVEISGIDSFTSHSVVTNHSSLSSEKDNEEESTTISDSAPSENQKVNFNDEMFVIENSDKLYLEDIVSGTILIQSINGTVNDIWYQYILIPQNDTDEAIAIGSYRDIIVTSRCSELGWKVSTSAKDDTMESLESQTAEVINFRCLLFFIIFNYK